MYKHGIDLDIGKCLLYSMGMGFHFAFFLWLGKGKKQWKMSISAINKRHHTWPGYLYPHACRVGKAWNPSKR